MASTSIQWTHPPGFKGASWNPTVGCRRVSPGCGGANGEGGCYAENMASRIVRMSGYEWSHDAQAWEPVPGRAQKANALPYLAAVRINANGRPGWTGHAALVPDRLDIPLRTRAPTCWFVDSMSDLFHVDVTNEQIAAAVGVMAATPRHRYIILTKRAERLPEWFGWATPERIDRFRQLALVGRIAEYFADEREAPIPGFPGYAVTSRGRIVSDRKGPRHDLKPMIADGGHCRVCLYRGERDEMERPLVHRLVLSAFDRAPLDGEQACHLDGDPTNNALWNLRWGTQSDNWIDRIRHGNGRSYAKLSEDDVVRIRFRHDGGESSEAIARSFRVSATQIRNIVAGRQWRTLEPMSWPLPGLWLGVSVENQATADERIPHLLDTPAAQRIVSYEPALGPVDFTRIAAGDDGDRYNALTGQATLRGIGETSGPRLDQIIVGGESGPRSRPFDIAWARSVIEQTRGTGCAAFFKQAGSCAYDSAEPEWKDGWVVGTRNARMGFVARKGDNPMEWHPSLRIREFPAARGEGSAP